MSVRVAGNAGAFYPKSATEVKRLIEIFNKTLDRNLKDKKLLYLKPKAIISPHAGYIYSGFTANFAHRILSNQKVKRVVVIGPSHHIYFKGISGSFFDTYQTPFGDIRIDREYLYLMQKLFDIGFAQRAHKVEHSTETQMPFIKYYQPKVEIIELIYGDIDFKKVAKIVDWLLEDSLTTVVISSDLSHFYNEERANFLDNICINGIEKLDNSILDMGCEACGIIGIQAVVQSAKKHRLKSQILDYRTSGDITGDKDRVVGYLSVAFVK